MSQARRVARALQKRCRELWRRLGRKGHRGGIACLTCERHLSPFLEEEAERRQIYHDHAQICPQLMLSSLDLRTTPEPVPARHAAAAAKRAR